MTEKEFTDFANRVVWKPTSISVLKDELMDQYSPLVKLMDSQLKKKHEIKKLLLPELKKDGNESIAIFSDYGGESADSKYFTYTFLICGWNHSYGLEDIMKEIRTKHNLNDKEISFKDFGYGPISRSLDEYLRALDNYVVGMLYTVVVEKDVISMFSSKQGFTDIVETLKESGLGDWKPKVSEKLLRIVHITAYLTALLSKSGQKILWMTDHDSIASNKDQQAKLFEIFQRVLPLYTNNTYETIGGAVPFEEKSIKMLDLLSAADIAAGSIEHFFTRNDKMDELTIKEEANKVLSWLGRDGIGLKKHTIMIKKAGDMFTGGEIEFSDKEQSPDVKSIPIYL